MKITDFKVLTFDVVGTLIDFEAGVLSATRRLGGEKATNLSDDDIFAPYLRGRDVFYGRSSYAMKDVFLHMAKELNLNTPESAGDLFQLAMLRHPAFADSVDALRRLRKNFRLVAMTNADRTAFSAYSETLENPFHDSVTCDEAGCAKPDPNFFAFNKGRQSAFGYKQSEILHVAQSQYHDIGVARKLGYATCWIERRQELKGFGGTPVPEKVVTPDFHFATLAQLAGAIDAELSGAPVRPTKHV